jgi:hypothetical protein
MLGIRSVEARRRYIIEGRKVVALDLGIFLRGSNQTRLRKGEGVGIDIDVGSYFLKKSPDSHLRSR